MSTILGTRHNDTLSALADGDIVDGLQGDDHLSSNFNRTALIGGTGNDTLTTDVTITPTDLHGTAIQDGGAGDDILNVNMHWSNITDGDLTSEVAVLGGSGDDQINIIASPLPVHGGGFAHSNVVTNNADGGAGDDHITISGTTGFFTLFGTITNHATGGSGDDVLDATAILQSIGSISASNSLDGGAGNDILRAYCFTDSDGSSPVGINELSGGNGNDMLQATQVTDGENGFTNVTNHLDGGNGNDVLVADSTALARVSVLATNHLEGGNGNDSLTAHLVTGDTSGVVSIDGSNVLSGGSGDDSLSASIEMVSDPVSRHSLSQANLSNTLDGGTGNDHLEASINMVNSHEGPQSLENHLEGGAGDDVLLATIVDGTTGSSFLDGGNGNDQLKVVGGSANVLNGGDGRDSLTGGTGNDFLFGGKAADTFHFDLSANQGTDTIGDFERERDILSFAGVTDHGTPGLADDLDAISTITDLGAGNDVAVDFTSGSHLVFVGVGTGHTDSWSEIVAHPALQLTV